MARTRSCWSKINSPSTRSWGHGGAFDLEILDTRPGLLVFRVDGKGADKVFANEAGGHRFQRVPPTEKKGRVQTSTVTVAVLPVPTKVELRLNPKDLDFKSCRGSGAGGQHRNVTDSAVQLTHKPTGVQVRVESERSQHLNRERAEELLRARLLASKTARVGQARSDERRAQLGSGMRGDKIRTIRVRDGRVTDHKMGKQMDYKRYARGDWKWE